MWILKDRWDLPHASCFKQAYIRHKLSIYSAQIHVALSLICWYALTLKKNPVRAVIVMSMTMNSVS